MKRTLKNKYDDERADLLSDAEQIEKATDYGGGCLRFNSSGDSSLRAGNRMSWVDLAEKKFLEDNKKNILKLAAKLCREYAGDEE